MVATAAPARRVSPAPAHPRDEQSLEPEFSAPLRTRAGPGAENPGGWPMEEWTVPSRQGFGRERLPVLLVPLVGNETGGSTAANPFRATPVFARDFRCHERPAPSG